MPGIVGIITRAPKREAEAELATMLNVQLHEDFYNCGTWINEALGVYLGWTAIEGSFSDGMPWTERYTNQALFFSGEEYGQVNTSQEGDSPGGTLLRLAVDDPDFLSKLDGLFHGVFVDPNAGSVTIFNDRFGMHRLCYYESAGAFYFAAEAKAILAALPDLREACPKGIGEFLSCSCVLENRTIFKNIFVMPGGSRWVFRNGEIDRKETYFSPSAWEDQTKLDPDSYYQALRESLARSLPSYFRGPQQVALALTGGMDTRVLLAQYPPPPRALPTYTFGGMLRECRDVTVARTVAAICGQEHQVIVVGRDFLSRWPHYAERTVYLTEGCVDVYRSSDLYLSEKARQIAPAKVVGTYGSEILRCAVMFKPMLSHVGLFDDEIAVSIQQAQQTYAAIRKANPVTFAAFRQSPWYHHGVLALEQSQLSVRSPFLANDFVAAAYRAPSAASASYDVRLRLIRDGHPALARIPSDRGVGGGLDPATSALARAYFEFTFKAEYACDYGMPQWATRINSWVSPLKLDRLFLGQHKYLHYRTWYHNELSRQVREILLDPRTLSRPYLKRDMLESTVNGHMRGVRNATSEIHKLVTLEFLFRQFFDAKVRVDDQYHSRAKLKVQGV